MNKHIVITGGTKGIGLACTNLFLKTGWKVSVLDIDIVSALENQNLKYYKCDVSKLEEVKETIGLCIKNSCDITALVNNAGIQRYDNVVNTSEEQWDEVMGTNLKSAFLCAKYCIPSMQKLGKGVVINVASVQAFISQTDVAAYTTSKTALIGLTRSIAIDFAPEIRCVAVCPGTIDTPMLRSAIEESSDPSAVLRECVEMHPLQKIGSPEDVAELISFLVSDKASFITGQAYRVDGGLGISVAGSRRE